LIIALICTACGPISKLPPLPSDEIEAERRKQQTNHVRDYFAQLGRLHSVAFRLRAANRDDCKDWAWAQIGLDAGTVASLPRRYRSVTHDALTVSWTQATVLSVAETSPASMAGIKPGDQLLTFNNEPVPHSDTARWIGRFVRDNGEQAIRILVRHDGVDEMRTVTPVKACAIPIELKSDSSPDAFTTSEGIVVHSSVMRMARTDAQLAFVVGHELAHANLGHLQKRRANQLLGWASGAAIDVGILFGGIPTGGVFRREFSRLGERAFSVGFEREADYVGMYLLARASRPYRSAADFWRRMGAEMPGSILFASTHPTTAERYVRLEEAAAEIDAKSRSRNCRQATSQSATKSGTDIHPG